MEDTHRHAQLYARQPSTEDEELMRQLLATYLQGKPAITVGVERIEDALQFMRPEAEIKLHSFQDRYELRRSDVGGVTRGCELGKGKRGVLLRRPRLVDMSITDLTNVVVSVLGAAGAGATRRAAFTSRTKCGRK